MFPPCRASPEEADIVVSGLAYTVGRRRSASSKSRESCPRTPSPQRRGPVPGHLRLQAHPQGHGRRRRARPRLRRRQGVRGGAMGPAVAHQPLVLPQRILEPRRGSHVHPRQQGYGGGHRDPHRRARRVAAPTRPRFLHRTQLQLRLSSLRPGVQPLAGAAGLQAARQQAAQVPA